MYIDRRLDQLIAQNLSSPWSVDRAREIIRHTSGENIKANPKFFGVVILHQLVGKPPDLVVEVSAMGDVWHRTYIDGQVVESTLDEAIQSTCPRVEGREVRMGRPPGSGKR